MFCRNLDENRPGRGGSCNLACAVNSRVDLCSPLHRELKLWYGYAVVIVHLVASQHEDHLEPRKRVHHTAVFFAEAGHRFGRCKGKVHAGFEQEAIAFHKLVQIEALWMSDEVRD